MIGANRIISLYRLTGENGKSDYSNVGTLKGQSVYIVREDLEKAAFIDEENAYYVYRMESDELLDAQEGDKVIDDNDDEYIVSNVWKDQGNTFGDRTICIMTKRR